MLASNLTFQNTPILTPIPLASSAAKKHGADFPATQDAREAGHDPPPGFLIGQEAGFTWLLTLIISQPDGPS